MENYLSFIRLEVQVLLDTHVLISVLTPFGMEGGRKYCHHLFLEDEETSPYFSRESLYPSVWLHGVILHTIRNKFAFFISPLRPSAKCIYHEAERLKISVLRPSTLCRPIYKFHLFLLAHRD